MKVGKKWIMPWVVLFTAFGALAAENDSASYSRGADSHNFTVFMKESGYCWFEDPRVIVKDGKLIIGAIQGNGSGEAHVGVYDLDANKPLGTMLMQDNFDRDDHNSPVFYARPDNRILSVYAKHHREPVFYYRLSEPNNPLKWSEEMSYETKARATYTNLYEMKNEGKLYNFFRGIEFNPTFVTSTDGGKTWGEETHLIASELNGTHRPYCRYAGNGTNTIYISFTDGHPRRVNNSLYYAEFRNGKFWKADGTLIKDLKNDGPLRPSEAELIYKGSGIEKQRVKGALDTSVENSAWTSSMVTDKNGSPHIAYSVHKTNDDHRYRIASWDGKQWHDREVAYAGSALSDRESSYTGLITLDPVDPTYVVISTDVDPFRGVKKTANHEIYRAKIGLTDANTKANQPRAIKWEELTWNSPADNLRPIILRDGDRRIILWNRGVFNGYRDYQMDAVGFVEAVEDKCPITKPFSQEGMLEAMKLVKVFQERGGKLNQDWIDGTFYTGLFACYEATGNEAFLKAASNWVKPPFATPKPSNADAICAAQTFVDVYRAVQDETLIAPIHKIFETEYFGVDVLKSEKIGKSEWEGDSKPFTGRNIWSWCDALYMAPPVMARMGAATGDPRYFELLHKLYWDTVDYLYSPENKLFYREKKRFDLKAPNGEPAFWGRGNGWVIGGLVRTIDYIPESDPMREKYIQLFRDMMSRLITLQGDDGLWRSSVNDPNWYPMPETSGSGFFVFAMAAGVNRGWLDRETYLPAAKKGWKGLVNTLNQQGKVQWSQLVALAPYPVKKEHTRSYTQGIFLLAASEMYKLEGHPKVTPEKDISKWQVEQVLDVATVTAGFPVRFCLLTEGDCQYVAYYDADHQMTVASRMLNSQEWQFQVLPTKVGWDSHNYITMALDKVGQLHVSGNMHATPLVYFRTEKAGDITTLKKAPMVGELEIRTTYPKFLRNLNGDLIFTYRHGGSGNGISPYNIYDPKTQSWSRFLETPLFDGEGKMNAYPTRIVRHLDGWFHVVWVWRDSPDCATNHDLSYARSKDLIHWESAFDDKVTLPIKIRQTELCVDPIPSHGGIINSAKFLFIDSKNRPIVSYHKSDKNGNMQVYAAFPENGAWKVNQLTDWDKPIVFGGRGSMGFIGISISGLSEAAPGLLTMTYRHRDFGNGRLLVDEETLKPADKAFEVTPEFPKVLSKLESDFPRLGVQQISDIGDSGDPEVRYVLKWETLPHNRDRKRETTVKPSMLKLYKLRAND